MKMSRTFVTIALTITISVIIFLTIAVVVAASMLAEPDFDSEEARKQSFAEYLCRESIMRHEQGPGTWPISVATEIMANEDSTSHERNTALRILLSKPEDWDGSTGWPPPLDYVTYGPSEDGGKTCSGWLWDRHYDRSYENDYPSFTWEEYQANLDRWEQR